MSEQAFDPATVVTWKLHWVEYDQMDVLLTEPVLALESPSGEVTILDQKLIDDMQKMLNKGPGGRRG